MRQSVLTLWFTTFFTFFIPVLSCHQRYYMFYKEYQSCYEAEAHGVEQLMNKQCNELAGLFNDLNNKPEMQQIFGTSITSQPGGLIALGDDSPNCRAWTCQVVAWRYREWETTMENRALPQQPGWQLKQSYYGEKVHC